MPFYFLALFCALASYAFIAYIVRSPFGIALQGIRENPRRMESLGFNVVAHRVSAYVMAGFIAGFDHDDENSGSDGARARSTRSSSNGSRPRRRRADPAAAARAAAEHVLALTGREFEGVVSVEQTDDGWRIGVELVETRRIPDTADILAVYEVETDHSGELCGLRRVRRYARGQLQQGGR